MNKKKYGWVKSPPASNEEIWIQVIMDGSTLKPLYLKP